VKITLAVAGLVSVIILLWVWHASSGVCVYGETEDVYQKMIASLDGIVDLGLKLSTSLVGVGAALLIGLKSGLTLQHRFVCRYLFLRSCSRNPHSMRSGGGSESRQAG
jgi:hypothetical protein